MFKQFILATILLLTKSISFGQLNIEDYHVYTAIIKTEIQDSTKSVGILKDGVDSEEKSKYSLSITDQLTSNNQGDRHQIYLWTENKWKERPSIIDSNDINLLIDYSKSDYDKFILTPNFNQNYKTIIIKKFHIRQKTIDKYWEEFYRKYPGAGGVFSFSKVKYYTLDTTAIFYYWVRRNGLNGHGALAVMTKIDGDWQMKYKIYLWHN